MVAQLEFDQFVRHVQIQSSRDAFDVLPIVIGVIRCIFGHDRHPVFAAGVGRSRKTDRDLATGYRWIRRELEFDRANLADLEGEAVAHPDRDGQATKVLHARFGGFDLGGVGSGDQFSFVRAVNGGEICA